MSGIMGAKEAFRAYTESYRHPSPGQYENAVRTFFADDADINVVHPINKCAGAAAYEEALLEPLMSAFNGLYRYDYIAMGGEFEENCWVSSTGYYVGDFRKSLFGIKPTNALAYVRFAEFHRIESDRAVESYIYLDLPELMIAAGQWPIAESPGMERGYTGMLPGPATQDGLQWHENDHAHSASSFKMVVDMLLKLKTEDEAWRPYWHENMMWFGPAGFGSFVGIEGFAGFQVPFEEAFSEWIGGATPGSVTKHFTRFGDGNYVCSGGWPSLNCMQVKPFLGQAPTGERIFMRVCDHWRREGDLLVENWVFVDLPDVLMQLGRDVFAELGHTNT